MKIAMLVALLGSALLAMEPAHPQAYINGVPPVSLSQDIPQIVIPSSGDSVVSSTGSTLLILTPAAVLATLTVNLPANPIDGQRWGCVSTAAITLMTFSGGSIPIKGAMTTLGANGFARFYYSATLGAWLRTG